MKPIIVASVFSLLAVVPAAAQAPAPMMGGARSCVSGGQFVPCPPAGGMMPGMGMNQGMGGPGMQPGPGMQAGPGGGPAMQAGQGMSDQEMMPAKRKGRRTAKRRVKRHAM